MYLVTGQKSVEGQDRFHPKHFGSNLLGRCRLSALAAIAVFPVLTLLLIGLVRAENVASGTSTLTGRRRPAEPPSVASDRNPAG